VLLLLISPFQWSWKGADNAFPKHISRFHCLRCTRYLAVGNPSSSYVFGGKIFHRIRVEPDSRGPLCLYSVCGTYRSMDRGAGYQR